MPRHPARRLLALALALPALGPLTGCLEELPEPSKIDRLRVLAIRAEPPEAMPGEAVQLSALVVDPAGRTVTTQWSACLLPERAFGFFGGGSQTSSSGGKGYTLDDAGSCAEALAKGAEGVDDLGSGLSVQTSIPDDFMSDEAIRAAYRLPEDLEIPGEALLGIQLVAGINMSVSLVVQAGGDRLEAYKRINVSSLGENENPTDVAFHIAPVGDAGDPPTTGPVPADGRCFAEPVTVDAGRTYRLRALNIPDPQVTYPVLLLGNFGDPIAEDTEVYYYSYFSTHGVFDRNTIKSSSGETQTWTIPDDAPATIPLWIVTRDGRGGTTWCEDEIAVTR